MLWMSRKNRGKLTVLEKSSMLVSIFCVVIYDHITTSFFVPKHNAAICGFSRYKNAGQMFLAWISSRRNRQPSLTYFGRDRCVTTSRKNVPQGWPTKYREVGTGETTGEI